MFGISKTTWGGSGLPLKLDFIGMPKCQLFVSWDIGWSFFVFSKTQVRWSFQIPADTAFIGIRAYNQAWVIDKKANAAGIAITNAIESTVGS